MGRLEISLIAVASAMLLCAAAAAQTTQPASIPQGPYEKMPLRASDSATNEAASTTQPVASVSLPDQLDFTRVAMALGIVITMILGLRWVGKKYFPNVAVPRSSGTMKVLSRLAISPKQQFLMIQIGKRIVVVGDSTGQMSPISEITDPEEVAGLFSQLTEERSQQSMKGFGALFHRAGTDFEEKQKQPEMEKPAAEDSPSEEDPAVSQAHEEFNELADKVRLLSAQFRRSV
ncbi:MAG TPA: flagellar biosynthetic protein FliO [Tepidisphaeraceae bacterium]|nr:flagellar biosynthetic protein FliO [Tepidisphaeraceae bacterium]